MVDRIKFIIDNVDLDEVLLRKRFFKNNPNKDGRVRYIFRNNYNSEEDDSEDEQGEERVISKTKYHKYLYIEYITYKKPIKLPNVDYLIKSQLIIHRNIRKEGLGNGRIADLSFKSFENVINKYGKDFNIEEKKLWSARVTKVELGLTLSLNSSMKGILSCFESFNGLPEKHIYGSNGISFIGNNYSVSFYDKIEKMDNNDELFVGSSNKKKLKAKITKNNYFLRFELKVEKVSGFYQKNFVGKINHLSQIRDNWDYILKSLASLYDDVKYVDVLSPAVTNTIRGKAMKEMNNYLKFMGIQFITKDVFFQNVIPLMKDVKLSFFKGEYRKFYDEFERKFRYGYKEEFKEKLDEKIEKLLRV